MNKITEDFLYPFAMADITKIHTIVLRMIEYGVDADDVNHMVESFVDDYVKTKRENTIVAKKNKRKMLSLGVKSYGICPKCKSSLATMIVNSNSKNQIDGDYTHMLVCKDVNCTYNLPFKR